jgi:hypothetical protein
MLEKNARQVFQRFAHLALALRGLTLFRELDALDEKMLSVFAAAWYENKSFGVIEAMSMIPDVSARTVHRRLVQLRQKGFITLDLDQVGAKKRVLPTPRTLEYFDLLGHCLLKSTEQ